MGSEMCIRDRDREEMRAISESALSVGTSVEVVSAEGITLTVKAKE